MEAIARGSQPINQIGACQRERSDRSRPDRLSGHYVRRVKAHNERNTARVCEMYGAANEDKAKDRFHDSNLTHDARRARAFPVSEQPLDAHWGKILQVLPYAEKNLSGRKYSEFRIPGN